MRLADQAALITGGYGGMGRASGRPFCQEGATVFVAGRSREKGEAFVKQLIDAGATPTSSSSMSSTTTSGTVRLRRCGRRPVRCTS